MISVKTKREIDYIRESARIVAETHDLMRRHAKPGVSTLELDMIAEDYIRTRGGVPAFKGYKQPGTPPFPGSICASIDEVVVHGIPSKRELKEGEILSVDVGVEKNGYFGDAATSIAIGEISEEKRRLMETTERSLELAIEAAKAGARVGDISHAVQSHVEANGFSVVRALCGHGVGKRLHEDPSVPNYGKPGVGKRLKAGVTLAIEPMVNVGTYDVEVEEDGWTVVTADRKPSAHYEHTVVVGEGGAEILSIA
ncbi:MAG: type I methionyl aminopeptidase [Ignavibacteriales bacterium]|nr:type I methionyl aminopeptidase [Ignavibacteriales bacterium]